MAKPTVEDLATTVRAELAELEIPADGIFVFSATGPYWRFQVELVARRFEVGVDHRSGLCCWEITQGNEKNLISPAVGPVFGEPEQLRQNALRLVKHAVKHPGFGFGDPQIV